jgi:hypothetical protein
MKAGAHVRAVNESQFLSMRSLGFNHLNGAPGATPFAPDTIPATAITAPIATFPIREARDSRHKSIRAATRLCVR